MDIADLRQMLDEKCKPIREDYDKLIDRFPYVKFELCTRFKVTQEQFALLRDANVLFKYHDDANEEWKYQTKYGVIRILIVAPARF